MKQTKPQGLAPKLRFPEFRDAGEWEVKKLGEVATFYNGKAYKQEELLENGKYRVLRVGNFFTNDNWYYSDLELDNTKYCENGDLLYAWSASFGPRIWKGEKVIYHYHIWKVVAKKDVNKNFLLIVLDYETEKIKSRSANGLGLLHITKGTIESWEFYIPVSTEQQKIADCLFSLDETISAETEKLEALKVHKKGLMQALFPAEGETVPKRRFSEFQDAGEWEFKKLGEVCNCIVPGRDKPKSFTGNIPWITIPDIQGLRINSSINKLGLSLNEIQECGAKIVPKDSVVMSCVGTFGLVSICDQDLVINQQLHAWLPTSKINNYYLAYSLIIQTKQMEKMATNTTISYLNKNICNAIIISITSLAEQQKIADCLSSLDELIALQTQKIAALKQHKKGLMQQLFPSIEEGSG